MSAEIDFSHGRAAIAYRGETPWHGLGQEVVGHKSIREWQKLGGLDWTVKQAPLTFLPEGSKVHVDFKNRVILYRDDTNAGLGVVSSSHFKIVQPVDVLNFYGQLIDGGLATMDTVGSLLGGKKIWALADLNSPFSAGKSHKQSDTVKSFLLFATGMDGATSTVVGLTSIRVVCQNTLSMALRDCMNRVTVTHRENFDPEAVKEKLGIMRDTIPEFARVVRDMARVKLTDDQVKEYFSVVVDNEEENLNNKEKDFFLAYKNGPGSDLLTAKGTLWGALNAITYYVDHVVGRAVDTRLNKTWFGANSRLKNRALSIAIDVRDKGI